jgi:hypothetical protein
MNRLAKLQLLGPLVLAAMIIAAEMAAEMLAINPSSSLAWYLNLELFGLFQRSHYVLSDRIGIPYFQLLFVALPILVLVCAGTLLRRRMMVALATNLSLVYVFFLGYSWRLVETPALFSASLGNPQSSATLSVSAWSLLSGPHVYPLLVMAVTSLLSFAATHLLYVRAVRQA